MSASYRIPVAQDGSCAATFAERCVGCGRPPSERSALALSRLVTRRGRQTALNVRLDVPHCARCARATRSIFLAGLIPALAGFLLVGGALFVGGLLGAWRLGLDESAQPGRAPSLVIGAAVGLLGGLLGGLVFEALARVLLLPFFGGALLRAPLLVAQLLSDSDYVAGLLGRLVDDGAQLELRFADAAIGEEFGRLNRASAHD